MLGGIYFEGAISSRLSTFKSVAILSNVAKSGCMVLLHHLLTVQVDFPNCSASHIPVFCCSTSTTYIRFRFAISS